MTASMSKKHFDALAAAIKAEYYAEEAVDRNRTALLLASVCARFNPNFNRARFLKACGVEDAK